ncbi:ATP-dependent Clp protease proteolytic subunit [Lactococcus hodotermopsidis]|uniref:ATP-dependent Clp protease proteolytic subunit n=1 Tax=Pseudolactococcus hodotermopsidis TaxID=2709157 RepID=A0A6A0BBL8_9LACT|nr:head maturation protease, ClpP-related [Lactococcus hodotermopsidis]GFH42732.1 ATP-dependent Clp protease proteolytic subunit [Lactococcus hodotermopsidis]
MLKFKFNGAVVDDSDAWFYDWFGDPYVSPKAVKDFLAQAGGQDIQLSINSGGGSVFAGSEIFTALKEYGGKVEVVVSGLAASIASVVAMAGDTIKISPLGQLMIHNAAMVDYGDYREFDHASQILFATSESLAKVYAEKTGQTVTKILALMGEETWMTADKAVELGFADEVLFAENEPLQLVASVGHIVSKEKVKAFKAMLDKSKIKDDVKFEKSDLKNLVSELVSEVLDEKTTEKSKPVNDLARFVFL